MRRWWSRRTKDELDCPAVRRLVQSYLDGELPDERAREVAAHLHRCAECGIEADTLRRVMEAIGRRRPPTDADVIARLASFSARLVEDGDPR